MLRVQAVPSPVRAVSPVNNNTLLTAIRHAFFPFQGVAKAAAPHSASQRPRDASPATRMRNLPRIKSFPDVRPTGYSPRVGHASSSSTSTPLRSQTHAPRASLATSTASPRPIAARAERAPDGHVPTSLGEVVRAAHLSARRAATSAASEHSSETALSGGAQSVPGVRAATLPGTRHARAQSYGGNVLDIRGHEIMDGFDAHEDAGLPLGAMSAVQYVAITLPALQQQVELIETAARRRSSCRVELASLTESLGQRHGWLAQLQRLQSSIREVRGFSRTGYLPRCHHVHAC
jgi:hypothetical protein